MDLFGGYFLESCLPVLHFKILTTDSFISYSYLESLHIYSNRIGAKQPCHLEAKADRRHGKAQEATTLEDVDLRKRWKPNKQTKSTPFEWSNLLEESKIVLAPNISPLRL